MVDYKSCSINILYKINDVQWVSDASEAVVGVVGYFIEELVGGMLDLIYVLEELIVLGVFESLNVELYALAHCQLPVVLHERNNLTDHFMLIF